MSGPAPVILIVEDELPIRRFLRPAMEAAGWRLVEAETGAAGIVQASQCTPDVIVLDLGLPDMEGLEVIKRVRGWTQVPIVVLSARGQDADKVAALDAGADDYVQKPFSVGELMARIRVALRRATGLAQAETEAIVTAGELVIDLAHRRVTSCNREVRLTPIEYKLLTTLVRHPDRVMTHRQLLKEVWGSGYAEESHYLRIFIRQLRRKLERDPTRPRHLITEIGVGYRFRPSGEGP